jgi:hypothetical protein
MSIFMKFKIFSKNLSPQKATAGDDIVAPSFESLSMGHGFAAGCYDYDAIWYYERCRWQA